MTYSKETTVLILQDWAKGATAEETRSHIKDIIGHPIGLATIYRHRNSLTTQQLIDELLRQQERDLTKEENSEVRMKYRNELLKILLPIKAEILSFHKEEININRTFNLTNMTEEDKIAVLDAYRRLHRHDGSTGQPPSLH